MDTELFIYRLTDLGDDLPQGIVSTALRRIRD